MRGIPAAGPAGAPDPEHPRTHALSIAAATHLHNAGHLPAAKKAQIQTKARASLARLRKASKDGNKEPAAFGSLAPEMDEGGDEAF